MGVGEATRVGVLMGGTSSEHDVSLCTGLNVLDALSADLRGVPIYLDREGEWHFGHRPAMPTLGADSAVAQPVPAPAPAAAGVLERLRARTDVDLVFIALHGPGGEDGSVQGLCTVAGIPFTGSGVLASALAMDKALSKRLFRSADLPVAPHVVVRPGDADDLGSAAEAIGLPCVVKPVAGGSSFATTVVRAAEDLPGAVRAALATGPAMVEAFLEGVEVTCGVLGGGSEAPLALPVTEIAPPAEGFFDFQAKYTVGGCEEITPARIDAATTRRVQDYALRAHSLLGCEGCSRSDFIVTEAGPVLLELNTIPGMTATSLLPQGAAAAGIEFPVLVERLVRAAMR